MFLFRNIKNIEQKIVQLLVNVNKIPNTSFLWKEMKLVVQVCGS